MTNVPETWRGMPCVRVGIIRRSKLRVRFNEPYETDTESIRGLHEYAASGFAHGECRIFSPRADECTFTLCDVMIGKEFHWQQLQDQTFRGTLLLRREGDMLQAVNLLPVEWYLESVVASEMSAEAYPEFLKAHAVISRSWLMAQIEARAAGDNRCCTGACELKGTDGEIIRWYDQSGHTGFDVCADDHCQRYQGLAGVTDMAREAVEATRGEVLMHDGEICDARFSKCCGGAFETFENCWASTPKPYLRAGRDILPAAPLPDLRCENQAKAWIESRPEAFCATRDDAVLSRVLKSYDRETCDFYRWTVRYTRGELSDIVRERSGIDFGEIIDLVPLQRGESARIVRMKIVGTRRSLTVGKELEIRRWLSRSHLYSSAFTVERIGIDSDGMPAEFELRGAGWGHGVGLCQIGAAVMASRGHDYRAILAHYFPGAALVCMSSNAHHWGGPSSPRCPSV